MNIKEEKIKLRKKLIKKRNIMSDRYRKKSSSHIANYILGMNEYKLANKIFCYVSINSEVETHDIITRSLLLGKEVFVPYCYKNGMMDAVKINSLDDLTLKKNSLLEPKIITKKIGVEEIDFSIIPCITTDLLGNRLGYGGGYYDRFYEGFNNKNTFILCFNNMIEEKIPTEKFDYKFSSIITELGNFKI